MPRPESLPAAARKVIGEASLFQGVETVVAGELIDQLEAVHFRPQTAVFREGEFGNDLYIIVAGKVKIGRRNPDGRESLLSIMGPADVFGELSVFDPGPRMSSATAVTEVRAARMNRNALLDWVSGRPDLAEQLLRILARRLRRTNDTLTDLIFTDVTARVAKQLLHLAERFGTHKGKTLFVTHDLTQEELAQLVGATRETVNKALSELATRGWIHVDGRSVVIESAARLRRRAGLTDNNSRREPTRHSHHSASRFGTLSGSR